MNNVCTHIYCLDAKFKCLRYYGGNYDTHMNTRKDQDAVRTAQYKTEQRKIAEIKDFIASFSHGTVKIVRQAQSPNYARLGLEFS